MRSSLCFWRMDTMECVLSPLKDVYGFFNLPLLSYKHHTISFISSNLNYNCTSDLFDDQDNLVGAWDFFSFLFVGGEDLKYYYIYNHWK